MSNQQSKLLHQESRKRTEKQMQSKQKEENNKENREAYNSREKTHYQYQECDEGYQYRLCMHESNKKLLLWVTLHT